MLSNYARFKMIWSSFTKISQPNFVPSVLKNGVLVTCCTRIYHFFYRPIKERRKINYSNIGQFRQNPAFCKLRSKFFGKNFLTNWFLSNFEIWTKIWPILIFDQNFIFWPKFWPKIWPIFIFWRKHFILQFWMAFTFCSWLNFQFWPKLHLTKNFRTEIIGVNSDFDQQFSIFKIRSYIFCELFRPVAIIR